MQESPLSGESDDDVQVQQFLDDLNHLVDQLDSSGSESFSPLTSATPSRSLSVTQNSPDMEYAATKEGGPLLYILPTVVFQPATVAPSSLSAVSIPMGKPSSLPLVITAQPRAVANLKIQQQNTTQAAAGMGRASDDGPV